MNLGWGNNRNVRQHHGWGDIPNVRGHHSGWGLTPPPPSLPPPRRRPADSVLAHRRVKRRRVFQSLTRRYETLKEKERDFRPGHVGWYFLPALKYTTQISRLSFYFRTIVRTCFVHPRKAYQALPPEIVELICEYADEYVYEPIPVDRANVHPHCRHMIPRDSSETPQHGLYSDIDVFFRFSLSVL